jgi:predicted Zn finger-like uncharacterized protein
MIIQCSACQTRFRLADDKVKETGTKVRCSRCGEVFTVLPPGPEPPGLPSAVAPVAEPKGNLAAARDEERPFEDWSNFGEIDLTAAPPAGTGDDTGAESSDFSFGDTAGETARVTDFALGAVGDSPTEDFSGVTITPPPMGGENTDELAFEDDLGSGVVDEFDFDDDSDEPFPDLEGDQFSWDDDQAGELPEDEFDLGGAVADAIDEGVGPESPPVDLAEQEVTAEPARTLPPPPLPVGITGEKTAPAPPAAPPPTRRKTTIKPQKKTGRGLSLFLLLMLLAAVGGAGYFYWKGALPNVNQLLDRFAGELPQAPPASKIQVTGLSSQFITNQEAGQLFVISGQAVNGYEAPRSALAVKGVLFNQAGMALREQAVYCGNPLTESDIKTLPLRKIRDRGSNQFGDSLANLNVAPGKSIPFTIVFNDLPPDLAEFNVEPAESIPGNKN